MNFRRWLAQRNYYRWTIGYIAFVVTLILIVSIVGKR